MSGDSATGGVEEEDLSEEVLCAVCEVPLKNSPSYRITRPACDACKKFFWRNRNTDLNSLICVTQFGECDVVGSVGPNSNVRRPICAHCRLAKCYAVGMQKKGAGSGKSKKKRKATSSSSPCSESKIRVTDERSKTSSSEDCEETSPVLSSGETSPIVLTSTVMVPSSTSSSSRQGGRVLTPERSQTPVLSTLMAMQKPGGNPSPTSQAENFALERLLRLASEAVVELSPLQSVKNMTEMPWTISYEPVENDVQMWTCVMNNFNFSIQHILAFIRHLSEIADLPVTDKSHLFATSFCQIWAAQLALSRNPVAMYFGMNDRTRDDFLRYFPSFKVLERQFDELSLAFAAWSPNFFEFALLQAILFFRVDLPHVLERPSMVIDANRRLTAALMTLIERSDHPNTKSQNFRRIVELLRSFEQEAEQVLLVTLANRSDLLHMNQLFAEMHITAFTDRQQVRNQSPQQR